VNAALGSAGVALGLGACVLGVLTISWGLIRQRPRLVQVGRVYVWAALAGAILCVVAMERALITRDFSLAYVAQVGSSATPPLYNMAALWSSLEGSLILWVLILSGYTALVAWRFRRRADDPLVGWALATMLFVGAFFFLLMFGPANPFAEVSGNIPLDGPGPNPLLQNHLLMAFHPPMLYLGYVGFTVPFAFAVAALMTGRVGEGWLLETRRWTLFAWAFLTLGIMLGAWWSYEVLGWGGYWAWDPVENASFLPWLTATAYIHSVLVQERRGMLRVWNLSLLCATFALTILGTFLTRSGVLDSVHAFTEGHIGPWLLTFFGIIVFGSIALIGWRGDRLRSPGSIDSPLSREAAFLLNNVLFAAFAFVVLLGTVFPLLVEALQDERVSVGRPFFDRMTSPLALAILFLMAVAPVLPWRKATVSLLTERLFWPAWVGVATVAVALALGASGAWNLVAFGLAGFAAGSALRQLALATRRQGWRGMVGRANGGMVVHIGVILVAVALVASSSFSRAAEFRLAPGETASFGGHTFEFVQIVEDRQAEKIVVKAEVLIDGEHLYAPSQNLFFASGQVIGTPSVKTSLTGDIYLTLERRPGPDDPTAAIKVLLMPLTVWLWIGGAVMALGTLLAAVPGRGRRRPTDPVSAPIPEAAAPPAPPSDLDPGHDPDLVGAER
jgi:cytochrome c-type biogenesis protein CcmF